MPKIDQLITVCKLTKNNMFSLPQSQESLNDQIWELCRAARRLGLYDAEDFLMETFCKIDDMKTRISPHE